MGQTVKESILSVTKTQTNVHIYKHSTLYISTDTELQALGFCVRGLFFCYTVNAHYRLGTVPLITILDMKTTVLQR